MTESKKPTIQAETVAVSPLRLTFAAVAGGMLGAMGSFILPGLGLGAMIHTGVETCRGNFKGAADGAQVTAKFWGTSAAIAAISCGVSLISPIPAIPVYFALHAALGCTIGADMMLRDNYIGKDIISRLEDHRHRRTEHHRQPHHS